MSGEDRVRTFIRDFDQNLGGGLPVGSIVMVTGPPGTMKSTLCYYILYKNVMSSKSRAMYINIEQDRESFEGQMRKMGLPPADLDGRLTLLDLTKYRENLDDFGGDSGWVELVSEEVQSTIADKGADLLVIDSLDAFEMISGVESPREQLFHFFRLLKDLGLTALIVSEGEEGVDEATMREAFMVDGVILLRDFELSETNFRLRIRCAKLRGTRHSRAYYNLDFKNGEFSVTPAISE